MGKKPQLNFALSEEFKSVIENEADELNMSKAEYVRQRIRAGRRLFNASGKLNKKTLADWVESDEAAHLDANLTTNAEGLEDEVLSILSVDQHRALSQSEIRKEIFGSVEEQETQIDKALDYLADQDQIRYDKNANVYKQ